MASLPFLPSCITSIQYGPPTQGGDIYTEKPSEPPCASSQKTRTEAQRERETSPRSSLSFLFLHFLPPPPAGNPAVEAEAVAAKAAGMGKGRKGKRGEKESSAAPRGAPLIYPLSSAIAVQLQMGRESRALTEQKRRNAAPSSCVGNAGTPSSPHLQGSGPQPALKMNLTARPPQQARSLLPATGTPGRLPFLGLIT